MFFSTIRLRLVCQAVLILLLLSCWACSGARKQLETQVSSLSRERDLIASELRTERQMRMSSEERWSDQVATLQRSLEDSRQVLAQAEARFTACKSVLHTAEIADKRQVITQLEGCMEREPIIQTAAFERGMLEVWESIEFRGYPTTIQRDFWFDDYYFTFEVKVRGRTHKWTVQTRSEETGFAETIKGIFDLISLFTIRK